MRGHVSEIRSAFLPRRTDGTPVHMEMINVIEQDCTVVPNSEGRLLVSLRCLPILIGESRHLPNASACQLTTKGRATNRPAVPFTFTYSTCWFDYSSDVSLQQRAEPFAKPQSAQVSAPSAQQFSAPATLPHFAHRSLPATSVSSSTQQSAEPLFLPQPSHFSASAAQTILGAFFFATRAAKRR